MSLPKLIQLGIALPLLLTLLSYTRTEAGHTAPPSTPAASRALQD